MKAFLRTRGRHLCLAAALLTLCGVVSAAEAGRPPSPVKNMDVPWIERPWGWRYLIYISPDWKTHKDAIGAVDAKKGPAVLDRNWESLFDTTRHFPSKDPSARPGEGVSVVVVEFDKDGNVLTPNKFSGPLRGRIDQTLRIVLAAGQPGQDPQFRFGKWFLGLGDVSTHWAPGVCGVKETPSPFSKTDTGYLYGPAYEIDRYSPTVGCREWAYQLYSPARPYIDVTSYVPKKFDEPDGNGAYIHAVVGWARFDDNKPIIGQHDKQWYCLHECPGGDKPGVIPDIQAWAKKNGWPVPKPPTRVPVFPDPPAKSGTYPQ